MIRFEYVIQGLYEQSIGWEDLTSENTKKEAQARLDECRENERGFPHRMIKRRIDLDD